MQENLSLLPPLKLLIRNEPASHSQELEYTAHIVELSLMPHPRPLSPLCCLVALPYPSPGMTMCTHLFTSKTRDGAFESAPFTTLALNQIPSIKDSKLGTSKLQGNCTSDRDTAGSRPGQTCVLGSQHWHRYVRQPADPLLFGRQMALH